MSHLFSELKVRDTIIRNRVVMPPMVCFGWTGDEGLVSERHIRHYEARAKGGVGLIVIEATCVSKDGRLTNTQLGLWTDEQIDGFREIADRCHKHGAKVIVQLHHAGFNVPKIVSEKLFAPSEYVEGVKSAGAMTIEEIHELQQDFTEAAIRAEKAGFDGIELHGAHGYLLCQFASPIRNRRHDAYGGSLENRMRCAVEIIDKIRGKVSEDFIIAYRMGGNEPTLEEGIGIAKILESKGIDILHVSAGISKGELPSIPEGFDYNWIVYCGIEIKKQVNIPVIVVNDIRTPERAAFLVENQLSDLVAIGKPLLVDPDWAEKARLGLEITACLKCIRCQWFKSGDLCPVLNKAPMEHVNE